MSNKLWPTLILALQGDVGDTLLQYGMGCEQCLTPVLDPRKHIMSVVNFTVFDFALLVLLCIQAEVPAQTEMRLAGVNGFLPYKAAAELIAAAHTGYE